MVFRVDRVHHQDDDVIRRTGKRDDAAGAALPPSQDVPPNVNNAFIGGLLTGGTGGEETAKLMLPVMGCENKVVLAIAETSDLGHWKESMLRHGRLSYPELVRRDLGIEEMYLAPNTPVSPIAPL